jgi:hypothetical protein
MAVFYYKNTKNTMFQAFLVFIRKLLWLSVLNSPFADELGMEGQAKHMRYLSPKNCKSISDGAGGTDPK